MNTTVIIDWKFIVALGTVTAGTIFAVKMDASAVERVLIHSIDAVKECAVTANGNC